MRFSIRVAFSFLSISFSAPSFAASDEAWKAFQDEVRNACLEAAGESLDGAKALVDPFGSETFGLALVGGKSKWSDDRLGMICVFNKQTKTVELSGELDAGQVSETLE